MRIVAHRGNFAGKNTRTENSLPAIRHCLAQGWSIETDIRRTPDGAFYISHDPDARTDANHAEPFLALLRDTMGPWMALNVKELGYESSLVSLLSSWRLLDRIFLFDMELLEDEAGRTAALLKRLEPGIHVAARVSDHGETVDRALGIASADIIWLDEFDQLWVTEDEIRRMKSHGKTVYAISPEIHGFSLDDMEKRWKDFTAWGIDGICTDYAERLARRLSATHQ